ncbi:MAG: PIG-L deacetylase family protein [Ktedonobacterales bacterium]
MADSNETSKQTAAPRRVLIVMAHHDDGEFSAGATLAKWAAEGRDISYCLVTDGQVGDAGDVEITSEELAQKRRREAQAAADALGVQHPVIFLHYWDSILEPTLQVRMDIARVIRQTRPDAIICQDPTVRWSGQGYINHPDHRAAGEATLAAIMPLSDTRLATPELNAEGLAPHQVNEVYIVSSDHADRWVDVEGYLERKIAALRAHVSQMRDWDPAPMVEQWAKENANQARKHGHDLKYAESFKYIRLMED